MITTTNISIRNSRFAIIGLRDMIEYINKHNETKQMSMVEIGSYVGDSTKVFAESFGKVISIDPYVNGYDPLDASSFTHPMSQVYLQFKQNVLDRYPTVHHIQTTSEQAAKQFKNESIDFAYLDGDHRGFAVSNDMGWWLPKIKRGGWIGGHDYDNRKNAPDVKAAVDKYFIPDKTFKDTSWLKRLV